MKPSRIWSANTKFIELDVEDGTIGASLIDAGFPRFLAVSPSEKRIASITAEHPGLARHLTRSSDPKVIRRNNADVLILSGKACRQLWRYGHWRHTEHVAWCFRPGIWTLWAAIACLWHFVLGRLRWAGAVRCRTGAGQTRYLIVFKVRRGKRRRSARYYVPHGLGIRGFLERLSDKRIRYVVLRWFESLPDLGPGEDVDFLVDDDDFDEILGILDEGPGIQPCDVYTVTGLPGSDYYRNGVSQNVPYFPPRLSEAILAEARPHEGICRVPCPEHHFLSLAYHAIYHKGRRSGLPSREGKIRPKRHPKHDYVGVLETLAGKLGIDVRIRLEDLDEHLDARGWRPPRDMLARLASSNRWIQGLLDDAASGPEDRGLGVFLLREEGLRRGGVAKLASMLEHHGFEVVMTKHLTSRESKHAARSIRGGNWGRGPWKVSGGPPVAAVVTYDVEPIRPTASRRRRFPQVTNARVLLKRTMRDAFNRDYPQREPCNVLHSSDNGREAVEYLQILMPEAVGEIEDRIGQIRQAYHTPQPVVKTLTRYGRRAKVELIEHAGRLAVKKTFKSYQRRYCQREAAALRQLSPVIPEIPPLLASDRYSVIVPYYDDVLQYRKSSGKLFPLRVAKQAVEVLRKVYEANFALIDANVENVIVDRKLGLKLIDLEFACRYRHKPSSFAESYDIAGCPEDFDGDLPNGGGTNYARDWQRYVGLSLDSLLNDPEWLQHVKRFGYYLAHSPRFLPRRIRHYYRLSQQALRTLTRRSSVSKPAPGDRQPIELPGARPGLVLHGSHDLGQSDSVSEPKALVDAENVDSSTKREDTRSQRAA